MVHTPIASEWAPGYPLTVPAERAVDPGNSPQDVVVGGRGTVHLSLEYLVESGAAAPEVKVTITSGGTTSTWTDTGIAPGYYHKHDFMSVEPGAKLTIEVTDAFARVRWCESICC
jgi:hypothetical protein